MKSSFITSALGLCFLVATAVGEGTTCMPGYFITDSGNCRKCTKGTFQPKADQYGCKPCPEDKVSMEEGSTECVSCGENKIPSELNDKCVCIEGAVLNKRRQTCTLCAPGTSFVMKGRKGRCESCEEGYFQSEAGQTSCLPCPPGTLSNYGAEKCVACSDDEFLSEDSDSCETCPAGEYKYEYGNYCNSCERETFKPDKGLGPCKACPVDTVSNDDRTECVAEPCPEGEAVIKGKCGKCPPGRYYDSYDKKCSKCYIGSFMPYESIEENCFSCTANSFAPKKGATECIKCPLGQRLLKNGECGTCPAGFYYDESPGRCRKCGVNEFSSGNMDYCESCPYKLYSLPGAARCFSCPKGQAVIVKRKGCGSCPPGKYYDEYDGSCDRCYGGSFRDSRGIEDTCQTCPEGTTSNKKRTACVPE